MARRSATRASTALEPNASPRVRDFSRSSGPELEWDARTAFDFVFSLSPDAASTEDVPATDRTWLAEAKQVLRTQVGDALDQYGTDLCIILAGLAVDHPEVTDAASFEHLLRTADDREILHVIAGEDLRDLEVREIAERALDGDREAIAFMADRIGKHHDPAFKAHVVAVYEDPKRVIGQARAVFAAWLPAFQTVEPRVAAMLQRDIDGRVEDRETLGFLDLVERTTGGVRWLAEPGVRRLILAPSYFARPYNFLLGGADWRMFGYPIADSAVDAVDPLAPSPALIRLHRALGDETRLRILRLLRDRDRYLTEIAGELDLSKPTIKHHLALLRAARLVTVTEAGALIYYSLRPARLDDAASEVKHFLLG